MAEYEPKKLLILYILEILRKHTDKNHTLTQQEIIDYLESEYGMAADRKTVRRNLSKLMEARYPVYYQGSTADTEEITRTGKAGKVETILTNWYYYHPFEYGELSLLIDSVLSADALSKRHRTELIKKIEELTSEHYLSAFKKTDTNIYDRLMNGDMIFTIENIRSAIAKGRQLQFQYYDTGTDFKLHPRTDENDKPRTYTVNPYKIIMQNGHQYLICNLPEHDDLTHFRIDRIKSSEPLPSPARRLQSLRGFENGIQIAEYVKTHPMLWSGATSHITFRCKSYMMNDIADCFGTGLHIEQQPDDMILVHVHAGEDDVRLWAVQFADAVEVLTPQHLREQIAETLRKAVEKYGG